MQRNAFTLTTMLVLTFATGCQEVPSAPSAAAGTAAPETESLPPAIVPPTEGADPTQPPSYEVAIATAAAERNGAKKKCVGLPETERVTCEEAADASFDEKSAELEDLRGNQQ